MAKVKTDSVVRSEFMEKVRDFFEKSNDEVLLVKSNTFSIPWVHGEEEGYINLTFSIPKGARGGDGYDGYEEARNYAFECEEKAKKKAKREEEKKRKVARDSARRAKEEKED